MSAPDEVCANNRTAGPAPSVELHIRDSEEKTNACLPISGNGRGIVVRGKETNFPSFSSEFRSGHAEQTIEEIKQ